MSDFQVIAQKHFRRNFTCHFVDGIFALTGWSALGIGTILPGLIHQIVLRQPSLAPLENRLAAAINMCFTGIYPIAGLFFAARFETLTHRKPVFITWAFVARLGFVFMAIATALMLKTGFVGYLALLYASLFMFTFIDGAVGPQWMDFVARQIPQNRRGILFGGRDALGTLFGVGLLAGFPALSRHIPFPYDYAILHAIVAVTWLLSWMCLASMKEIPYSPADVRPPTRLHEQFHHIFAILREDRAYRRLMIGLILLSGSGLASITFFTLKATRALGLAEVQAANFTSILALTQCSAYALLMPLSGLFADRWGYKRLAYLTVLGLLVAYAMILASHTLPFFYIIAALYGATDAGMVLLTLNFPLEFCPETRRPSYMAVKCFCMFPALLIPLAGGWFADRFGYSLVFILGGAAVLLAAALFYLGIADPRRKPHTSVPETIATEHVPTGV